MKKVSLFWTLAWVVCATSPAFAKDLAIGALGEVKGHVGVSGNGFVHKATAGTPVFDGSKILVSTDGRAVVLLHQGCSVTLAGGQHLVVDAKLTCAQQQASVQQLFRPYRLAQAPVAGGLENGQGGGPGGGGAGGGAIIWGGTVVTFNAKVNHDDRKVSPN